MTNHWAGTAGRPGGAGDPRPSRTGAARGWRAAATDALYGSGGFYRSPEGPAGHFRTSVSAGEGGSPLFAGAVLRLVGLVDDVLDRPQRLDLVDVGAGRGELLLAVLAQAASVVPALTGRLRLVGVDLADRPAALPAKIDWVEDLAEVAPVTGVLLGNEWLDNVPVDVVELTEDGPALVLVEPDGRERLGLAPDPADLGWLSAWWPLADPGDRAEIGRPRDEAWAAAVRSLDRGLAVAMDYAHDRVERALLGAAGGTLTGYRAGRQVAPVPDGSCDITAHVALDACAAAGTVAGARQTLLTDQRTVLRALGLGGAARPGHELARTDPASYLRALQRRGQSAELLARGGLGDFGWLLQSVGAPLPVIPFEPAAAAATPADGSPRSVEEWIL